jgi:hypothetical protein
MLNDVAIPLAQIYAENAFELVLGYDQQRFMSERAGRATAELVKQADYSYQLESSSREEGFEVAA